MEYAVNEVGFLDYDALEVACSSAITAYGVARHTHKDQKYGTDDYFDSHVCAVAKKTEKITDSNFCRVLALLHDVVEDGNNIDINYLRIIFGDRVADGVSLLTHTKSMSYDEYIQKIIDSDSCEVAVVKFCDAQVNLEKCIKTNELGRAKKYLKVMAKIEQKYHFL